MVVDKHGGIAILEKGTSFGGGALQNYLINSNTSAEGFLYCLDDVKSKKRATSSDKKPHQPSEEMQKKRSNTLEPLKTQQTTSGEMEKVRQELTEEKLEQMIKNMTMPLKPY